MNKKMPEMKKPKCIKNARGYITYRSTDTQKRFQKNIINNFRLVNLSQLRSNGKR